MSRSAQAISSSEVKTLFADSPTEYSTGPLWTWNDDLTEEQIISSLHDLAEQNVKQAFIHPRPGLMTPYLSEKWFHLWKVALDEAGRLDMNIWIYDENSYPSGFAGGHVPDQMPESRLKYLTVKGVTDSPKYEDDICAIYRVENGAYEDVTQEVRADKTLRKASYHILYLKPQEEKPWYGGKTYVNLLKPGVTRKFLEITLEPYRKRFGDQFGKRICGVFTDEPVIQFIWGLPWSDQLPEAFEKRWGYRLYDHLICLFQRLGDWKRFRHNYYQLLNEQFVLQWGKPYYEYCDKYGLELTGHYYEHRWPRCLMVTDNMSMYVWQHRPGIDLLTHNYNEGTNGLGLGNVRVVKELSSIANQLGKRRTLCETYGAGGWDIRFEDLKRIGDFLYVLGVNTLNQHFTPISMCGARKRDHPQYFSYHVPWWEAYHISATYFTRLSAAMSQGQEINRTLLIEPTTTAWIYHTETGEESNLYKIGNSFQRLVVTLSQGQVEYDIGSEYVIANYGSVEGNEFVVGKRGYNTVIISSFTENLNVETVELLEKYVKVGGTVICCGDPPSLTDGNISDRCATLSSQSNWKQVKAEKVPEMLQPSSREGFAIHRSQGDEGILYHHRRQLEDGQLLLLVNTSIDSVTSGRVECRAGNVERWNPETGEVKAYPFEAKDNKVITQYELSPCGSLLLFLSSERGEPVPEVIESSTTIESTDALGIKRIMPNVLTLDYVDITVDEQTRKNIYFYNAAKFVFTEHGLESNPWEQAVQFRDELITKKFADDSGFEATYRFTIEEQVPTSLFAVIERSDRYMVTCNGKRVSANKEAWWVDKSFGKIDIMSVVKVGDNALTIKAWPMTMYHELEPVYVIGDFWLKSTDSGFVMVPDCELKLGPWNRQGHPFYGHSVSYKQKFNISGLSGQYHVSMPSWYGSVAKVVVNDRHAGYIAYAPWECEVTNLLNPGENDVEVIVIGTPKNTFGPHHGNPPLGEAWPRLFYEAPPNGPPAGKEYSNVGYGLFKPFQLKQVVRDN
ncbi:MAG: glycosyl hydrolase [Planctomycetota bacterium]|jgi:hypothetical protein